MSFFPSSRANKGRDKKQPQHGQIVAVYAVIYDQHLNENILVPASRAEILQGQINQGRDW